MMRQHVITMVLACHFSLVSVTRAQEVNHPLLQITQGHTYRGQRDCKLCHERGEAGGVSDFCLMTEYAVFMKSDPHAQAAAVLDPESNPIAARIWQGLRGNGEVTRFWMQKQCLSCHAGLHPGEAAEPQRVQAGVSCEVCHGPASTWVSEHSLNRDKWRVALPTRKTEQGFLDVRHPVTKAVLCNSCHIGDVRLGRVVTHAMYAAGHPPLPGIELEAFSTAMPRHWRTIAEKKTDFTQKDEYLKANPLVKQDHQRTRTLLVGAVMAMRSSVALMTDSAAAKDGDWPQLAVYDCAACHHDLRPHESSWRQQIGYDGLTPGRPRMFHWPEALMQVVNKPAETQDAVAAFRKAVLSRPFGDRDSVVTQGRKLVAQLDELAADLSASQLSAADVNSLLAKLEELNKAPQARDYLYGNQIRWAIASLKRGLVPNATVEDYSSLAPNRDDIEAGIVAPYRAATQNRSAIGYPRRDQPEGR